jgi:hypothetical protein
MGESNMTEETINITFNQEFDNGEILEETIHTTSQTWGELILDFAKLLTCLPDQDAYCIDLDILQKHIKNATLEQLEALMGEDNKDELE